MGVKGFVEGGITSIVAGYSTHSLDLLKVCRMFLSKPNPFQTLRHAIPLGQTRTASFNVSASNPKSKPRVGLISVGVRLVKHEGIVVLFSGVSSTVLRQTL